MKYYYAVFLMILLNSCSKDDSGSIILPVITDSSYYFPKNSGDVWEAKTAQSLSWNENKLDEALDFAGSKSSLGVIILQNGKIIREKYWADWNKDTRLYIASAGKSVTALVAGIAQEKGLFSINDVVSSYLGNGWTSLPLAKEKLITIKHLLTMTSGLDDGVADPDCTTANCLQYKADAGTRWAYHNAPYHLLQDVIGKASGQTYNAFCKANLFDKIGMPNALWFQHVMYCTTREGARFGSLILNQSNWDGTYILNNQSYQADMLKTSQTFNLSYGYLWWLNGKNSFQLPTVQNVFPGSLVPNAPSDMVMALGKNDQKIYVIPSLKVVVVRLGNDAGTATAGPSSFDNEFWGKLKLAMKY